MIYKKNILPVIFLNEIFYRLRCHEVPQVFS